MTGQYVLDLPHVASVGPADFLISNANRAALGWMNRWPDWPGRGLVLHGPSGSGKTHLAHLWRERAAAALIVGADLGPDAIARVLAGAAVNVALDDADHAPEAGLLHLYNVCAERGGSLLVVAHQAPGTWPIALPDLASRLRALPAAAIGAPDDALLAAVLVKHLADRQLSVKPEVIGYLTRRMERSFAAAAAFAAALDRLQLREGGPITIPLVRRVLVATGDSHSPSDFAVT